MVEGITEEPIQKGEPNIKQEGSDHKRDFEEDIMIENKLICDQVTEDQTIIQLSIVKLEKLINDSDKAPPQMKSLPIREKSRSQTLINELIDSKEFMNGKTHKEKVPPLKMPTEKPSNFTGFGLKSEKRRISERNRGHPRRSEYIEDDIKAISKELKLKIMNRDIDHLRKNQIQFVSNNPRAISAPFEDRQIGRNKGFVSSRPRFNEISHPNTNEHHKLFNTERMHMINYSYNQSPQFSQTNEINTNYQNNNQWEDKRPKPQNQNVLKKQSSKEEYRWKNYDERPIQGMSNHAVISNYPLAPLRKKRPSYGKFQAPNEEVKNKVDKLKRKWMQPSRTPVSKARTVKTKSNTKHKFINKYLYSQDQAGPVERKKRYKRKSVNNAPVQIMQQINIKRINKQTINLVQSRSKMKNSKVSRTDKYNTGNFYF